jgi:Lrp/AsnC family leucine-responsive transcriptional regulator
MDLDAPLDAIDRKLLALVQADNLTPMEELAARVGASRSAVQRRLKRLRAAGVIAADVTVVRPEAVGLSMTFIVEVELERERPDLLDEFRRSVRALPEVQQCYYVTGRADFVLVILARNMEAFERLTRQVFTENPNIRRFHTNVVVGRVKTGMGVPVEDDQP